MRFSRRQYVSPGEEPRGAWGECGGHLGFKVEEAPAAATAGRRPRLRGPEELWVPGRRGDGGRQWVEGKERKDGETNGGGGEKS